MASQVPPSARAFEQPFAEAFPDLREAIVECEGWSRDIGGATRSHGRFTMSALSGTFRGRITCPHPECHGGGFEIERLVDQMVRDRQESREGVLVCPGWIGDRDQVPCVNSLTYSVVVFFRPGTPPEKPEE
jgi:hypothetical protein